MPGQGAEYALLQRKCQFENIRQTVASRRERARGRERYMLASYRNSLQQQRANIKNGLERLPVPTHQYYLEQIQNLDNKIEKKAKRCTQILKARTTCEDCIIIND